MMWSRNVLTERLGLSWPILQAPMGSLSTPSLAAAVSDAGGLGGLGMWGCSVEEASRRIAGFRQLTDRPLNVNYPMWEDPGDISSLGGPMRACVQRLYDESGLGPAPDPKPGAGLVDGGHLSLLLEHRPAVASFHFGLPAPDVVSALKSAGIFVLSSATTVAEARELEHRGVDAIIAQGTEAGSHRGTFSGTDVSMQAGLISLLPQVVDAVRVPVIAAGGIADGRGIAASLMLGASGVQIGTAFLRCAEANVQPGHRRALADAGDAGTQITSIVSGRPARFIRNRLVEELERSGANPLPFPAQLGLTLPIGASGNPDLTVLFAGQSAALGRDMAAGELVSALAEETTQRLRVFST
jgi:nitronate monooxygenase